MMRVEHFVRQRCFATESESVGAADLYAAYCDWCKHEMGWLSMSRDSFDNQLKRLGHNIVDGVVVGIGLIDTAALRAFMLHPMELPPHILKAIVDEAFGPEGETAGSSE